MKLLIVSPSYYPAFHYGGSIYSTHNMAEAIADLGHNIFVLTTNVNGNNKLNVNTNTFVSVKKNYYVKYFKTIGRSEISVSLITNLYRNIKKSSLIYLVSVFSYTTPFTLIIGTLAKKKIILAPKGQLAEWSLSQGSKFKKLWLRIFVEPFIKKIAWHSTSEQESGDIKKLYKDAEIFLIPHCLNISYYDLPIGEKNKDFYEKLTGNNVSDKKIIVSLSRLHKKKGYDILIKAFKLISEKRRDCVLIIAGNDYGEKQNLIELTQRLELTGKVFIIDHIEGESKKLFLANGDLFALATHNENFGMVYLEAMAAGLPVIASKNTPWQDVEKYNCGKWVDNTPAEFAIAIERLLKSDYNEAGKRAKDYAAKKFSTEMLANEYVKLFESLLNQS